MESQLKTFLIPNEMCRRAGVSGTFSSSNEIVIFPSQFVKPIGKDAPSPYTSNTEASIFQVRPEVMLFHPILRRLVNESSGIFVKLQTQVASKSIDLPNDVLLDYSIQYRSVIRACLENLKEEVMRTDGYENEQLQNYVTIFYSIECIWHLCEILCIRRIPGNILKTHLLDWVRFHIPKYERKAAQLMADNIGTGLESHAEYWNTVIGCLLQGRIREVRQLLEMHSNATTSPFRLADQTLKSMPVYDILDGVSMTEFNLRRKHWLLDTQSRIDTHVFDAEHNINFMMRLIVGEELAWNEVQPKCEAWYELLAAWVFYTDPTMKTYELRRYAKKCISRMGVHMKHIDHVLLAAMENDVELIKEVQCMNENGWFVTHLVDLMYHARHLDSWQTDATSASKLRESFILEYGTLLMGHNSMWQIGLNYLDHCPTQGTAALELLLPRVAKTEAKTTRVIREAIKRGLCHVAQSMAKVQCVHFVKHDRFGNALSWALKAQDPECMSHIVNKILQQYKASYVLPNEDLLNHLGPCMLASDSLMFLGKYYEYRQKFDEHRYKDAAVALVSLIGSKFTPKFFWDVLLTDTLRLLECKEAVMNHNATLIILNCLEERADHCDLKDKLGMLRMALSRNLSCVFTQTSSATNS